MLRRKFPSLKKPLQAVYIQPQDPFPQVEEFVVESVKRYEYNAIEVNKFLVTSPLTEITEVLYEE